MVEPNEKAGIALGACFAIGGAVAVAANAPGVVLVVVLGEEEELEPN